MSYDEFLSMNRSPAATLLPDLLYTIAHLAYPDLASQPAYKSDFMVITQVCRHWRYTFLSIPSFWTKIEIPVPQISDVSFLDELLIRSADYPLDVAVDLKYSVNVMGEYLDALSSHMHHVRKLIIRERSFNYRVKYLNYVFFLINKPAPMLKVFHFDMLTKDWSSHDQNFLHSSPSVIRGEVLDTLFNDMAPEDLQELHISCMRISHRLPVVKSLTKLFLKHVWGIACINHLFDILEVASNNLKLLDIGPIPTISPKFNPKAVDGCFIKFSSLETLSLDLSPEVLMVVLAHIKVPPDINWSINGQDVLSRPSLSISPLVLFLSKIRMGKYLRIKIKGDVIHMNFSRSSSNSYNATVKAVLSEMPAYMDRLYPLFFNLNFSEVRVCNIICSSLHSDPRWIEAYLWISGLIFNHLNQLKKLSIACDNTQSLTTIMIQLQPAMLALPCPLLSHLSIGLITAIGDSHGLFHILKHREAAGGVLQTLTVDYFYLHESDERDIRDKLKGFANIVKVHNFDLLSLLPPSNNAILGFSSAYTT